MKRDINDVKIIILERFEHTSTLTLKQLVDQTFDICKEKFYPDIVYDRHYNRMALRMGRYMKHNHPVFEREKIGNVYHYTINERGLERLKQLRTVFRFFGVYRLKREGTQLLVKTKSGNYAVNGAILPYAHLFCDVPMEKLKMYVGLL